MTLNLSIRLAVPRHGEPPSPFPPGLAWPGWTTCGELVEVVPDLLLRQARQSLLRGQCLQCLAALSRWQRLQDLPTLLRRQCLQSLAALLRCELAEVLLDILAIE